MKKVLSLFLAATLGGVASLGVYDYIKPEEPAPVVREASMQSQQAPVRHVNYPATPPEAGVDFTTAAERSIDAVVHVRTIYESEDYYNPFRDFLFGGHGQQPRQKAMSSGSGVIISDDGYIVTNNHVVDHAQKVEITLNNNRQYVAEVIGTDPTTDLALLKVDEQNMPYIRYGNSDELKVGEWVLAVGNPFNLTSTVTAGIVSAKARNINILQERFAIESFIQTDAAVNPGNSGGALVNSHGELIGINTAIASTTGSYSGYSFAVPVNIAKKVVDDLLEYGEVQRAFIGVSIRDIDNELADDVGIDVQKGIYVMGLAENGAARDAGIETGDIIVEVNGHPAENVPQLQEVVAQYRPGDKVKVTVLRNGKRLSIPVELRNKDGETTPIVHKSTPAVAALGAEFEPVNKNDMQRLNISHGVKVARLSGGKLRSAGIKEGFIITKIDRKAISSPEDVAEALENKKGGVLIEGVYPNGFRTYYGFGL